MGGREEIAALMKRDPLPPAVAGLVAGLLARCADQVCISCIRFPILPFLSCRPRQT